VWEAVTAVATAATALIIAFTALVGAREVNHLRRATQLDGTLRIFDELSAPEVRQARQWVILELPLRMRDEKFRAEVAAAGLGDATVHIELVVLRTFEKLGTFIDHGLVDSDLTYDIYARTIIHTWESLLETGVIAEHRKDGAENLWSKYERLYQGAIDWTVRTRGGEGTAYLESVAKWRREAREVTLAK